MTLNANNELATYVYIHHLRFPNHQFHPFIYHLDLDDVSLTYDIHQ